MMIIDEKATSDLESLAGLILVLLTLGQENLVDLGQDTTGSNGNFTEELVQLIVRADGELQVTGRDGLLLVVSSSVTGEFKNFSSQVLEDGSQVDGGTRTNALGIVTLAEETVNTTDGELESSLVRTGSGLVAILLTSFTLSHGCVCV